MVLLPAALGVATTTASAQSNIDSNKAVFTYGPNDWLKKNHPMKRFA